MPFSTFGTNLPRLLLGYSEFSAFLDAQTFPVTSCNSWTRRSSHNSQSVCRHRPIISKQCRAALSRSSPLLPPPPGPNPPHGWGVGGGEGDRLTFRMPPPPTTSSLDGAGTADVRRRTGRGDSPPSLGSLSTPMAMLAC